MKTLLLAPFVFCVLLLQAQKHTYDVILFGKKIGQTVVVRTDKGNGEVHYTLDSKSEANLVFTKKTSEMKYDITYKNGQLWNAYVKNMKDGVTEISNILWEGTQYLIKKGAEVLKITKPIDFSSVSLYFSEPVKHTSIFSERLGSYCTFKKTADGVYECKLDNGVINIYRYRNGVLYELEMVKGASVFLRLVK